MVQLHHMNKHKEFHIYRLKPIRNNIRGSWTKTGKSSKNLTFSDFHDFFYADIFSGFLWNFFSWFTYTIWTNTRSFIPTDWNQSEIIFEQVGQKQENRSKMLIFPIFFNDDIFNGFLWFFFFFMVHLYHRLLLDFSL